MVVLNDLIERKARDAVLALSCHATVQAAYVFGSHVTGTADHWSDIDIAAFIEGLDEWDAFHRARVAALVQKQAGDDVELHLFRADDFRDPPRASFASHILSHGVPVMQNEGGAER